MNENGNYVFKFKEVTPTDIFSIIKKLRSSKALGHDNISISFIKDGAQELSTPIAKLINLSIQKSFSPESEKLANITPIFKSGNHSKMENFRPISILPVFSKIFERVVHTQISYYLEQNGLLSSK